MAGAHIGHNCIIGNNVIVANNCLLAGHVRVDDGAFLGGGSTFHQFMHIGRLVMVQGSSAFGKDLPPFVIAAERNYVFGLNIVGLRRAGLSVNDRDEIKEAFKLIYQSGLNTSQALEKAATMNFSAPAREFLDFVANAKQARHLPSETRRLRRIVDLTKYIIGSERHIDPYHNGKWRASEPHPPCTGGMMAISSPGFSL